MAIIPIAVLALVFLLIAVRQVGNLRLQIWQVMLGGAVAVLVTGQISPLRALMAIDPSVMLFLFAMFAMSQAMEESGYISRVSHALFRRARSVESLVLLILFSMGLMSAFMMNDTMAIIGTPIVLLLARSHRISPKLLLLSLAFAVTIGSATSPIGNPQNLLIALRGGVADPFTTFFCYLFIPTVINLLLAYLVLRLSFRGEFGSRDLEHRMEPLKDRRLARTCRISLSILGTMIAAKVLLDALNVGPDFSLTVIALATAAPVLILGPRRREVLRKMDWQTLVFFASMFVLMESVWETGFIQSAIGSFMPFSLPLIMAISILLSQFISNVPLVALLLPLVVAGSSIKELMALAAGSTIAGNLTILGAASNVIIIQSAEKRGETLTFADFVRVGGPLTVLNALVYLGFLSIL
ncbi:MAG: SLC13 family permease [Candidatus Hadarchaeales archaeon]